MTEDELKKHIIYYGVESAAPQFGTSIAVLKGWMRGDSGLPHQVWEAWINYSLLPPEQRPPIAQSVPQSPRPQTLVPERPAPIEASSLAQRVLADPAIAARIKAETTRAPVESASDGARGVTQSHGHGPGDFAHKSVAGIVTSNLSAGGRVQADTQTTVIEFSDEVPVKAPKREGVSQVKLGNIAFCCVTDRDFPPAMFECFSVLIREYQMPLVMKSETLLVRGRNIVAERFLRTRAEWSFWVDSDMLVPFGNAEWFRNKSKISNLRPEQYGFDVVKRLCSHRADFVGGVYAARTEGSQLVIQPDLEPRHENDKKLSDLIRKNQAYGLKDVSWLGFGCCLVHRKVFEAISRTDPEIRSGKASFFDTVGAKGEDVRFAERAAAAGYRAKLDVELVCGHLGRQCFKPEDTKGRG